MTEQAGYIGLGTRGHLMRLEAILSNNEAFGERTSSQQETDVIRRCVQLTERVPGWTRGDEAEALVQVCLAAPDDAVIVEVGSFLGCGAILLASARQVRGSGRVHCVDPFDGSGDDVSVPHYQAILLALWGRSQREHFDDNLAMAGVSEWVVVHEGLADQVAAGWTVPIDLLFLDADQSPEGARAIYDNWSRCLKAGGIIALHNSNEREYEPGHDGYRQLVEQEIVSSTYFDIRCVGSTTFARRAGSVSVPPATSGDGNRLGNRNGASRSGQP